MNSSTACLIVTAFLCVSCAEREKSGGLTSDMHSDSSHTHRHQHGHGSDHEHDHKDGFKGSHSHQHKHSHRHGEPLHGGRIVSIGHTHHKGGATHFHAEVMPLVDGVIRFHLLTESDEGESKDYAVSDDEIPALISIKDRESSGVEASFVPAVGEEESSEFRLLIPDKVAEGQAFSVVIPKVRLGGHRQNFSFSVSRQQSQAEDIGPSKQETTANANPAAKETSND